MIIASVAGPVLAATDGVLHLLMHIARIGGTSRAGAAGRHMSHEGENGALECVSAKRSKPMFG
jgi:hypothetical protein